MQEATKLLESKNLLIKIASGINPVDDSPIKEESFYIIHRLYDYYFSLQTIFHMK